LKNCECANGVIGKHRTKRFGHFALFWNDCGTEVDRIVAIVAGQERLDGFPRFFPELSQRHPHLLGNIASERGLAAGNANDGYALPVSFSCLAQALQ
jgi:hypothetical protein